MSIESEAHPGLRVSRDADLTSRNSLRLSSRTDLLVEVLESAAIPEAIRRFGRPRAVLGGGSNVILQDEIEGPVFRVLEQDFQSSERGEGVAVSAGAGIEWDDLVDRCIAAGAHGIENLALIPGLVGAAPVQNIGAYGVELAEWIEQVDAFDIETLQPRSFDVRECGFGYRDSRFKREPGAWLVTRVHLRLARTFEPRLGYAGLGDELSATPGAGHPAQQVADAVRRIRRRKLPDPSTSPNAGSFFKNPAVTLAHATALRERWATLPIYPLADGHAKLSAAWMIERCGLKGARSGDAAVSAQHALVVVNLGAATAADVRALQSLVETAVRDTFNVVLEREPVLIEGVAPA